jgi:hypothetical protein
MACPFIGIITFLCCLQWTAEKLPVVIPQTPSQCIWEDLDNDSEEEREAVTVVPENNEN